MIEKYKPRTRDVVTNESNSGFGEKISMVRLIVIENISGIADTCKKFT